MKKPLTPAARAFAAIKKPRKKLRKHSLQPLPRLKKKADRALQDWYRYHNYLTPCEVCWQPFEIMHHVVEKSACAGLRFEEKNLVFLCQKCHARHHLRGDPAILGAIIEGRGIEWFRNIMALKVARKGMVLDRIYLQAQLEKYSLTK